MGEIDLLVWVVYDISSNKVRRNAIKACKNVAACYREGRTGDRFMQLVKSGQIANCCQPNALMTLKEYLEDYASEDTRRKGERAILEELNHIGSDKVRQITVNRLELMKEGKRDFRF